MRSQHEPHGRSAAAHRRSGFAGDLLLLTPFLIVFYIQLAHHNLWRDELNAFAITWVSPTLHTLSRQVHYEAHPWLWYVLLWLVSRFTVALTGMKLLEACIGTAIMLVIALCSPFRRWEKAIVLAGYFISFEYTVLSRMYGLVLLFLVLYCWWRVTRANNPVMGAVLLGLMASSDSMGIILSVALLLEYAYSAYIERGRYRIVVARSRTAAALGVYAVITGLALLSMRAAPDISWRTTGRIFVYAHDWLHLYGAFLRYAIQSFIPVKSPRTGYFWNPQLGRGGPTYAVVMVVILAMLYFALRRRRSLMLLVGSTIIAGTLFGHLIYLGSIRHYGITFLAFLAAVWIMRGDDPADLLPAPAYVLLALSALCGVWAAIASWRHPFSNAKVVAEWIGANHLEAMPLVGEQDTSDVGVAEYLHRPLYMIECACEDRYLLFSARRDNYSDADAPQRILGALHFYHDVPVLFVRVSEMPKDEQTQLEREGIRVQPLAAFTGAEEIAENFYLYRLVLAPPVRQGAANTAPTPAGTPKGTDHAE